MTGVCLIGYGGDGRGVIIILYQANMIDRVGPWVGVCFDDVNYLWCGMCYLLIEKPGMFHFHFEYMPLQVCPPVFCLCKCCHHLLALQR